MFLLWGVVYMWVHSLFTALIYEEVLQFHKEHQVPSPIEGNRETIQSASTSSLSSSGLCVKRIQKERKKPGGAAIFAGDFIVNSSNYHLKKLLCASACLDTGLCPDQHISHELSAQLYCYTILLHLLQYKP